MAEDHLKELRNIGKALERAIKDLGLEVMTFGVIPAKDPDDEDFVDVMIRVTPEALMSEEEKKQKATDDAFAAMMAGVDLSDVPEAKELTPAEQRALEQAEAIKKQLKATIEGKDNEDLPEEGG